MTETRTNRDPPVLRAIVDVYEDTGSPMGPDAIEAVTGFDTGMVQAALRALDSEEPPYISKLERVMTGDIIFIGAPTGHARRAVGAWPTAETIADRLVKALDEAADREPDPERKGWLSKTASYLGHAGRDLAVEIGATAINRQMGM
ncbi:hypothetical protein [Intrasporangium sp.]|uniref:hypothetical protein n=1 Tax=Intrasporangium sp. TaxID=1925024 RepID=UPI00322208F6